MSVQATFSATWSMSGRGSGCTDAMICPGSRSTPLAVALAERLRTHVRLDERSAAFFALGLAMATGRPAVICVTSGTAAAELHPAVVEAHHARVPLIVCTADRPPELHHTGAPQTIEQTGLFPAVTRWSVSPGVPSEGREPTWRPLAVRIYAESVSGPTGPGPVHLNLAFREPLTGSPTTLPPRPVPAWSFPTKNQASGRWHRSGAAESSSSAARCPDLRSPVTCGHSQIARMAGHGQPTIGEQGGGDHRRCGQRSSGRNRPCRRRS